MSKISSITQTFFTSLPSLNLMASNKYFGKMFLSRTTNALCSFSCAPPVRSQLSWDSPAAKWPQAFQSALWIPIPAHFSTSQSSFSSSSCNLYGLSNMPLNPQCLKILLCNFSFWYSHLHTSFHVSCPTTSLCSCPFHWARQTLLLHQSPFHDFAHAT